MSGSPVPDSLDLRSQTRRQLRAHQVRSLNTFDGEAIIWSDTYSTIDMVEAGATPSEGIDVRGYDSVTVFCEFTLGDIDVDGTGGFNLAIETALESVGPWYERHVSFEAFQGNPQATGDPVTIEAGNNVYSYLAPNGTGATINVAFEIKTTGHFMRVAPTAVINAGAVTNSRFRVRAIRSLESE